MQEEQRLDIRNIKLLNYNRRQQVRKAAIQVILDEDISTNTFIPQGLNRYPKWFTNMLVLVAVIALFATGSVSAFRIQAVGSETTCKLHPAFGDMDILGSGLDVCNYTGIAMFIMAESLAFLFPLFGGLLGHSRIHQRMAYLLAFLSMAVALVFNYSMIRPDVQWGVDDSEFAKLFLEWLAPPVMTLGIAFFFESIIMHSFEDKRQEVERQHKAALEKQGYADNPETHPRWWNIYPGKMRDDLEKYYTEILKLPQELIDQITSNEWESLIRREIRMDNLNIRPDQTNVADKKLSDTARAELIEENQWVAISEKYDWRSTKTYSSQKFALRAARKYEETQGLTEAH